MRWFSLLRRLRQNASDAANASSSSSSRGGSLTPEQLARIERSKQQALQRLKQRQAEAEEAAASEQPAKRAKAEGDEVCAACKTSAQLDPLMREHFNELVCFNCKDGRDEYDLMCKADVVAEYLLPEGTVRVLSFVEKDNPKKEGWNKMKLFLRKHVSRRLSSCRERCFAWVETVN
jgi:hypothetical protein